MTEDSERVATLEQRVEELEATVRGLTEELVDASERIRALEEELDQTPSTEELREARDEPLPGADSTEGAAEEGAAEAPKRADGEAGDNEESELDDIIVA